MNLDFAKIVAAIEQGQLANGPAIPPPRSWPKAEWHIFEALPRDVQLVIVRRERERDTAVTRAQQEAANLRKELAKLKESRQEGADAETTDFREAGEQPA
jgi:hypothetical protein